MTVAELSRIPNGTVIRYRNIAGTLSKDCIPWRLCIAEWSVRASGRHVPCMTARNQMQELPPFIVGIEIIQFLRIYET